MTGGTRVDDSDASVIPAGGAASSIPRTDGQSLAVGTLGCGTAPPLTASRRGGRELRFLGLSLAANLPWPCGIGVCARGAVGVALAWLTVATRTGRDAQFLQQCVRAAFAQHLGDLDSEGFRVLW